MTLSPEEIVDLDLKLALRGYATDQVDALLDRLADQIEHNEAELALLRSRLGEAEAKAAAAAEAEATVQRTLVAAQTTADRIIAEAEQQAAACRDDAEQAAATLRQDTERDARDRVSQAEQDATRIVAEAEQRQRELQERFDADTRELRSSYQAEHRQLQAAYDAERARLDDHLDALQTQAEAQMQALRDHLDAQRRALETLEAQLYSGASEPAAGTVEGGDATDDHDPAVRGDSAQDHGESVPQAQRPTPPSRPAELAGSEDPGDLPVGLRVRVREDPPGPPHQEGAGDEEFGQRDDHGGHAASAG